MRPSKAIFTGLVTAAGSLVVLTPTVACASAVGLEVAVAGSFLGGADLAHLEDAPSFEVLGSVLMPSSFEIGIGANTSSHDLENSVPGGVDITNVFGEVRYRFNRPASATPHMHPFLAGRVGYSRLTPDETLQGSGRNGVLIGGGGGMEYWFTNQVAAVGSAMLHYVGFDRGADAPGQNLSGTMTDIQVGMKVRF